MTSSTGERKWTSARRGGMTVLGKVAVPKPINLPSQRLENHGLDPNVEIVPKGTYSWGTRSSSFTSNAWGSSTLSPNTDGGSASPSHLSGRPSSGGSGTQPSTAGSDKTHEPVASAWDSHSRPSSASGALTSNHTLHTSLRPRSAETRPGSSQLSRFAEPLSDNSVAWGATGTTEKLGLTSSKLDGFFLISGDFPTLGSERETSGRNIDSLEHGSHGHPGSSSRVVAGKEGTRNSVGDISGNANTEVGNADSWRRDNSIYGQDGARPSAEKWQSTFQPYANPSRPPQHYDTWHGPPVNHYPGGPWYQQPSGGPPFGPRAAPRGFPMEPFPYYRPQIPSAALPNQQSAPPLRAGPRGSHPKNGDMYRPPIHDAYMHPGMPHRPGFYPGPAPCEGYYGPPMGYCNTSEQYGPLTRMAMGPPAAYRYSGLIAPDLSNPHSRSSSNGPGSKSVISEQGEFGHPQGSQGPYKVLLKQHDGCDRKDEQKWDEPMMTNSNPGKGEYLQNSSCSWENGCGADHKEDEEVDRGRMTHGEEVLDGVENQGSIPLNGKTSERIGIFKSSDGISVEKFEQGGSVLPEVSRVPKDPYLIQKIEGLNTKARALGGRTDAKSIFSREEQKNKLQACNIRVIHSSNEAVMGCGSEETHLSGILNTASHEDYTPSGDRNFESTSSRRSIHGIHSNADHRCKGRFTAQEADGWWRSSHVINTPCAVFASDFKATSAVQGQKHTTEVPEKSGLFPLQKNDGESMPPVTAPSDSQAQRAKMKELAEQRRKQREKEEEERTRDQKAKALAKLEELNRRTQAGEGSTVKLEATPIGTLEHKQEVLSSPAQPTILAGKSKEASSAVVSNTNAVALDSESSVTGLEKSASLNTELQLQIAKSSHKEPVLLDQLELLQQEPLELDVISADSCNPNSAPHVNGISAFRLKQKGHRKKQDSSLESYSTEKPIFSPIAEGLKEHANAAANAPLSVESVGKKIAPNSELSSSVNSSVTVEFSAHKRRKGKGGKNKQQPVEEALPTVASPSLASKDTVALEILSESNKSKASEPMWDSTSAQSGTNSKDASQFSEQHLSLSNEEAQIRINNQRKSQHSRRLPRNSQTNKLAEKFQSGDAVVWAPVRSQNKTEISDETSPNSAVETVDPSVKSDHRVQNNPRNKRAEMERYIPKPVAKEMAQQGSGHQLVASPISRITSDHSGRTQSGSLGTESTQTSVTSVGKTISTVESRNGDGRHSKSSKEHGSWHQRTSGESMDSNHSRNSQKMIEHHLSQKMYAKSVKEQSKYSDEWNASDGWNVPEDSGAAVTVPVIKDQDVTARGKRQTYRGHKSAGRNRDSDEKKISSEDTEKIQSSVTETCRVEVLATSKETRAAREQLTSHWQPKSHQFSGTNGQGSRPYGSQNVSDEVGRANKPALQAAVSGPLQAEKGTAVVRDEQPQHDQSLPDKSNLKEVLSVEHLEAKKEMNMDTHEGLPRSPVKPSLNMDFQHECVSSGFCKSGNQNNHFEHESQGDWNGSGRDNKQRNATVSWERHKQNSHCEYQPVGPHSTTRANNFEPPKDFSHDSSPRFRERGQSHSRRGGVSFHGRRSGNI